MNTEKAFTYIHLNNSDVFLILDWEKDKKMELKILNIEEKEAYQGEATEMELRSQAAKIRLSYNDFTLKMKEALFKSSTHETSYLYSLDQSSENYVFKWKSIDSEETIISLGSLEMEKVNFYNSLSQFLLSFSDEMQSMKSSMENLKVELSDTKSQLSTALTNLSDANDFTKNVEKELYSKFVLLLNEKKRKINELIPPISKKKKVSPINTAYSDESDEEIENISSNSGKNKLKKSKIKELVPPITKKKKACPLDMASSDEFDEERESISSNSGKNKLKKNTISNEVASCNESNARLENISSTSLQFKRKKEKNLFNILVSSSESDVDGEFGIEDPVSSKEKELDNSLQFDDEPKIVPQTQIRNRNVIPPKNTIPDISSHCADKDNISDDGSVDSLMELL